MDKTEGSNMDEPGKVGGEWASEAPLAQDASLGPTVRERVDADRAKTQAIRQAQQADPEGLNRILDTPDGLPEGWCVDVVAGGAPTLRKFRDDEVIPRFEHDSPHAPQQPSEEPRSQGFTVDHATEYAAAYKVVKEYDAAKAHTLPQTTEERKEIPLASGVLDYFPAALAEVAKVSKAGNDKHNPGEPLHWARGKSMDQADCIARHLLERGGIDPETGQLHSAQMAWRALALLQLELEEKGAPLARGAK